MLKGITLSFLLITLLSFFQSALLAQDEQLTKNEISSGNKKSENYISALINVSQTANITKRRRDGDREQMMPPLSMYTMEWESSDRSWTCHLNEGRLMDIMLTVNSVLISDSTQNPNEKKFSIENYVPLGPKSMKIKVFLDLHEGSDRVPLRQALLQISLWYVTWQTENDDKVVRELKFKVIKNDAQSRLCFSRGRPRFGKCPIITMTYQTTILNEPLNPSLITGSG